jgi:hypothetical protein
VIVNFLTGATMAAAAAFLFRIGMYEAGAAVAFLSVSQLILTHRS